MVRAIDARSVTAQVKRARFAFTFDSFEPVSMHPDSGNRAVFARKIPGFASPSHDGFALDGGPDGGFQPSLPRLGRSGTGATAQWY
jgi:hypothetical protein